MSETRKLTRQQRIAIYGVIVEATIGTVAAIAEAAGIDPQPLIDGIYYTPEQIDEMLDKIEEQL